MGKTKQINDEIKLGYRRTVHDKAVKTLDILDEYINSMDMETAERAARATCRHLDNIRATYSQLLEKLQPMS